MRETLRKYLVAAHKVGDFTLTSGRKSDFYIDVKSLMFNAKFIDILGYSMCRYIENVWADKIVAVGGMELGSVPISTAISVRSCKFLEVPYDHFVVRKQPKGHGTGAQIEGFTAIQGRSVLIVDDVLTTGGSIAKTAKILNDNGVNVAGALVVVDRLEDNKVELPFPVRSLFTKIEITGREVGAY